MAHHNPYVECPYNVAHQVPKLRMQQHLIKCRRNHPHLSSTMTSCPFNAVHIMPHGELEWHLRSCMDRYRIEGSKYSSNGEHGDLGNPSFHQPVPKEEWDDDDNDDDDYEPPHAPASSYQRPNGPDDPYRPGGALGPTLNLNSARGNSSATPSFVGLGRGRISAALMDGMKHRKV